METQNALREIAKVRMHFQVNNRLRLESLAALSKTFREHGATISDELLASIVPAVPEELPGESSSQSLSAAGKPPMGKRSRHAVSSNSALSVAGKPPMGKRSHHAVSANSALLAAGKPPMGKPPTGKPPLGKPPMGKPPLGKPPTGRPPKGRPSKKRKR